MAFDHFIKAVILVCVSSNPSILVSAEEPTQVTTHEADDYHTRWSPDGKSILFTSRRGGREGIWKVGWPTGMPVAIETGLNGDHHISWSPDGSEIAFDAASQNGPPAIWIIPVGGGAPRMVEAAGVPSFQPSWSPDGTMIGYVSGEKGNFDIWVIKVPER